MNATIFKNPGELDVPGGMTFGINVKEGSSAIGVFGTGLKYAIAILLREGQRVVIWSGKTRYDFSIEQRSFRGKEFGFIAMRENGGDPVRLGFTTELGKFWELWMAYRELYCNAKDEQGDARGAHAECAETFDGRDGETWVIVIGEKFYDVHESRGGFLLEGRTPKFVVPNVIEVYDGTSDFVFYRGIRAGKVPLGDRSMFTYNILEQTGLSEDRQLSYSWDVQRMMALAVHQAPDPVYLEQVLVAKEDSNFSEAKFSYPSDAKPSQSFLKTIGKLLESNAADLNESAVGMFKRVTMRQLTPSGRVITVDEQAIVDRARAWANAIGFNNSEYEVRVADGLGAGTLAMTYPAEKKIVLSTELLKQGVRRVTLGLIEETIHIRTGYGDMTRQFQTHLMEEIIRLGEEMSGDSLDDTPEAVVPAPKPRDPEADIPF